MSKITIDGREYELEALSDQAKAQIANIRYVDQKIADLQSQIAVMKAAREYYSAILKASLPSEKDAASGNEIKYEE